jgi:hypothetical protein
MSNASIVAGILRKIDGMTEQLTRKLLLHLKINNAKYMRYKLFFESRHLSPSGKFILLPFT